MAQQWDSPPLVVGVGELLWDLLPAGKKAGGAPFNFAFHATQAGARGIPLSRVGHDDLGAELLEQVRDRGLPVTHIQVDEGVPTGTVTVELQGGSPRYIIHGPTAWDQLSWTADWETVAKNAAAICFGTLAQRNDHARATIHKLVQTGARAGALIVADLNLRQHFYSQQILQDSIRLARWLKMSAEDWVGVARCLHLDEARPWEELKTLREKNNLELVAYTDGEKGAWLCSAEGTWTMARYLSRWRTRWGPGMRSPRPCSRPETPGRPGWRLAVTRQPSPPKWWRDRVEPRSSRRIVWWI